MINIYYPAQEEALLRYDAQSDEVKERLRELEDIDFNKYQLNVIKRKRPKLSKGDVFVLNPFGDIFFYGIVLNAGIDVRPLGKNLVSVCILKRYTHGIGELHETIGLTEEDVLLIPCIIHRAYWNNGYFYNINQNIGENFELDYGFYSIAEKCYVDEYKNKLDNIPKMADGFGFTTMIGIVASLYYELLIDNSFLTEEDQDFFSRHFEEMVNYEPPQRELTEFDKKISPFIFEEEHKRRYSVILEDFESLQKLFANRSPELEGNGYDWEALFKCFVKTNFSEDKKKIHFDSEAGMFYMYCSDEKLIKSIIERLVEELKENELNDYIMNAKFDDL